MHITFELEILGFFRTAYIALSGIGSVFFNRTGGTPVWAFSRNV